MRRGGRVTRYGDLGFERATFRFEAHIKRELIRIVAETAEMAVAQMKALAPVSTIDGGHLKDSIEVKYSKGGLRAVITVGAFYAVYVEYGTGIYAEDGNGRQDPWVYYDRKLRRWVFTRGMRAQPFFHPALEVAAQHFESEMNRLG